MNLNLVSTFQQVAINLLATFGTPVTLTDSGHHETDILAAIESGAEPVGEYGERVESRWTATLDKTSGAVVGDTLTDAAGDEWTLAQLLNDDGFVQTFALRAVTTP